MKVYIVDCTHPHEFSYVAGIFFTKEKAETFCDSNGTPDKERTVWKAGFTDLTIEEREVE